MNHARGAKYLKSERTTRRGTKKGRKKTKMDAQRRATRFARWQVTMPRIMPLSPSLEGTVMHAHGENIQA